MVMFLVKFALGALYDHVLGSLDHSILSQFVRRWDPDCKPSLATLDFT